MAYRRQLNKFRPRTSQGRFPQRQYGSELTGTRRHQFIAQPVAPAAGVGVVAPNEWLGFELASFKRTFDAGVTDDSPPTPTASNNYQTPDVFNGSKIHNFSAKIKIQNVSASNSAIWDVYEFALSFYDVLLWRQIQPATCPLRFSVVGSPGATQGEVTWMSPIDATTVLSNTIKNFKFIQHYMHHKGTVTLTPTDGGQPNAEININRLPPKCRRSQTGMFYGILLHNDSNKNDSNTLNSDASVEVSFNETPSDNRLPYID